MTNYERCNHGGQENYSVRYYHQLRACLRREVRQARKAEAEKAAEIEKQLAKWMEAHEDRKA